MLGNSFTIYGYVITTKPLDVITLILFVFLILNYPKDQYKMKYKIQLCYFIHIVS